MSQNLLKQHQENFVGFLKSKKRANATILAYAKDIDQLVGFLTNQQITDIHKVDTLLLNKFVKTLSSEIYTPKTVSRKINSIKTFYRFLTAGNIIRDNPAIPIIHPKFDTKQPRVLSKTEYRALRDACRQDIRTYSIVELLLQTGIRIGELARLTLVDVEKNDLNIRSFESHPGRKVPLNKTAKNAITLYLAIRPKSKNNTLYVTKTGNPLLIRNIRTTLERYFKIAGVKDAKVNDLRHTFITEQLRSGASLTIVSKIAGHKRLSTTEKYLELIKDKIEEKTKLEEL